MGVGRRYDGGWCLFDWFLILVAIQFIQPGQRFFQIGFRLFQAIIWLQGIGNACYLVGFLIINLEFIKGSNLFRQHWLRFGRFRFISFIQPIEIAFIKHISVINGRFKKIGIQLVKGV